MAKISKATYDLETNWYRVNLAKRRQSDAFRNIIIEKINGYNKGLVSDVDDSIDNYIERRYLFPSNNSNINGYYESIMDSIKFSCWVKCSESELLEILDELSNNEVIADASRKSNSGVIRTVDENEINTLRWIIEYAPQNLFRTAVKPTDTKPATLNVPGGVVLEGELSKMRGKVDTDKFYFSVMDTTLFMVISKGSADESIDLAKEIEDAKKAKAGDIANKTKRWMVLRASHGSEQYLEGKLNKWKSYNESDVEFETYLPLYIKDIKKSGKIIGQRKSVFCPGYLFIHASANDINRIESSKFWDGFPISKLLVRESNRKRDKQQNSALTISDVDMDNFKFAVDSNLTNVPLDADDYIDNEYVRYFNAESPFNNKIGKILHKGDNLYLSFLPLGGIMTFTKALKIESSQIRKLTSKEIAEINAKN